MLNLFRKKGKFQSGIYWENRYKAGGTSGSGSYNELAEFKSEVINSLISEFNVSDLIEFGCGDGNQLKLLNYKKYIGLDVSVSAIQLCKTKFAHDRSKSFFLYHYKAFADNAGIFKCDCSASIDVLFHLVEQEVFEAYMQHLFSSARKLIIIYAANIDVAQKTEHELFRKFTGYIQQSFPAWKLEREIKNKYPAKDYYDESGSLSDFFIYTLKG